MICPACNATNQADTEECFLCGRSLFALIQGRLLADRYEIRRPIGQGGMGKVYEAIDRVLKERVAVKVLRPQFAREPDMAKRFLSEIRLARRITHPNVCRLHEYGESEGIRYLCMELVDGVNLKDVLRTRRLAIEDAYDVAMAASEGLGAVHSQGVIHRDFKTANIMIDRRAQVKVMDFGIAKEVGSETTGVSLAGHVLGTPEYMSPEHAQGMPIDFRSDVYALGCVIFEIFAGRALFQGTSAIDTIRRHLHEPVAFANDAGPLVPEPLMPVLSRALAKKADDRYPSVVDLLEDLRAARADSALFAVLGDDHESLATLAALVAPLAPMPPELPPTERPPSDAAEPDARPGRTRALPPDQRPSGERRVPPARLTKPPLPGARPVPRPSAAPRIAGIGSVAVMASVLAFVWWRGQAAPPPDLPAVSVAPRPASPVSTPPTTVALASPSPSVPSPEPARIVPARPERERARATVVAAHATPPPTLASAPPTLASSPGTQPRPAQAASVLESPPPTQAPEPVEEIGVLSLLVVPPSEVRINGTSVGVISSRELRLPPGAYALRVENPDYHPYNRKVTVQAGAILPVVLDLADKGVRKAR